MLFTFETKQTKVFVFWYFSVQAKLTQNQPKVKQKHMQRDPGSFHVIFYYH